VTDGDDGRMVGDEIGTMADDGDGVGDGTDHILMFYLIIGTCFLLILVLSHIYFWTLRSSTNYSSSK
jgi:hypothetical protein